MKLLTIITNLLAVFVLGACTSTAFGSNRDGLEIGVEFDRINDIPSLPASSKVQVFDASDELDVSGLVYLGKATNRKALNNFSESPSRVSARGDMTASIIDIARRNGATVVVLEADNELQTVTRANRECWWRAQPTMEGQIIGTCLHDRMILEERTYQQSIGDIYRDDPALLASLRETRRRKAEEAAEAQRLKGIELQRQYEERFPQQAEARKRRERQINASKAALIGDASTRTAEDFYRIAEMFEQGNGAPESIATAVELHSIACDKDYGASCHRRAEIESSAVPLNQLEDFRTRVQPNLILKSCDLGFARGCSDAGNVVLFGYHNSMSSLSKHTWKPIDRLDLIDSANLDTAEGKFVTGCKLGDPLGCYRAGELIIASKNGADRENAYKYFASACREDYKQTRELDSEDILESCIHAAYLVYTEQYGAEPDSALVKSYLDTAQKVEPSYFLPGRNWIHAVVVYRCMRSERAQC